MKKIITFVSVLLCLSVFCLSAQQVVDKQTLVYSIKGGDTLRLDKYDVPSPRVDKPCVIFVFGGGFMHGKRDHEFNSAYLERLAESGYVAIGIDYRLGLKGLDASKVSGMGDVIALLQQSIFMAVEDLFDATRFVCDNAEEWGINKGMIIANGSSAGAIAVLQGEYLISHEAELANKLPEGFCYAGVISFGGAIMSESEGLDWPAKPAPMLLFHGDADKNVPYNKVLIPETGGLFGSAYIAEQLQQIQATHHFYSVENAAHETAADPMVDNLEEINSFISKCVIEKKPLMIKTNVHPIGKPEVEKDFTIMDYMQTNYM